MDDELLALKLNVMRAGSIDEIKNGIALGRCGELKGVKPRALLVAQLFLKLGNGDLDRFAGQQTTLEVRVSRMP